MFKNCFLIIYCQVFILYFLFGSARSWIHANARNYGFYSKVFFQNLIMYPYMLTEIWYGSRFFFFFRYIAGSIIALFWLKTSEWMFFSSVLKHYVIYRAELWLIFIFLDILVKISSQVNKISWIQKLLEMNDK